MRVFFNKKKKNVFIEKKENTTKPEGQILRLPGHEAKHLNASVLPVLIRFKETPESKSVEHLKAGGRPS